jgi:hypothetical protein
LTKVCVICGAVLEDQSSLTCPNDTCFNELKHRREIALSSIRAKRSIEISKRKPMSKIRLSIVTSMAKLLLERDIPMYISITDVDESICELDTSLKELTPSFRKSQITHLTPEVWYCRNSKSGHGKVSFKREGDPKMVRTSLMRMTQGGVVS